MAEELTIKLEKEKSNLENLKTKRSRIDERIKDSQAKINRFNNELLQIELDSTNQFLENHGLSLSEIMTAVESNDFTKIKSKL